MARPREPGQVRRIVEQTIMWLVLAGTVGAAALVDRRLSRMGPPQTVGDATLRLPAGWDPTRAPTRTRLQVVEPGGDLLSRTITVRYGSPTFSLETWLGANDRKQLASESIRVAGGNTARVRVFGQSVESKYRVRGLLAMEFTAVVDTPYGPDLIITIDAVGFGGRSDLNANLSLMRRILASLRFN